MSPRKTEGKRYTFNSVDALVTVALETAKSGAYNGARDGYGDWLNGLKTVDAVANLARSGWDDELPEALSVAESAVEKVNQEHTLQTFMPTFDVQGCDVDVARYLSGEPECMIDYPLTPIVKSGRVITLCASVCWSAAVESEAVIARGRVVTALALALSRLGYALEIWADWTVTGNWQTPGSVRVLVKSAHDVLDPGRLMFALAHPAMGRALCAGADPNASGGIHGTPTNPPEDLPDGTIYLPATLLGRDDAEHPERTLEQYLRLLEIVQD